MAYKYPNICVIVTIVVSTPIFFPKEAERSSNGSPVSSEAEKRRSKMAEDGDLSELFEALVPRRLDRRSGDQPVGRTGEEEWVLR